MAVNDQFQSSGFVAKGFESVRTAFEDNFARHGEVGAAVHVTVGGEPVVDPQRHLAMGYVMNKMIIGPDARYAGLCRAVYACLKA